MSAIDVFPRPQKTWYIVMYLAMLQHVPIYCDNWSNVLGKVTTFEVSWRNVVTRRRHFHLNPPVILLLNFIHSISVPVEKLVTVILYLVCPLQSTGVLHDMYTQQCTIDSKSTHNVSFIYLNIPVISRPALIFSILVVRNTTAVWMSLLTFIYL